jgi:hypothetical protein
MASTYVNDLRLNEMATGDASGTWGTVTNTNLELIGEALGYGTEAITTNADTHTTTVADGATDPGRAMYIEYTGTLDSACTITIAPNTLNRVHFIENGTSGSQNIIIKQGSGATITIPPGDTKAVYLDGAGSGAAVVDAFASLNVVDLKVQDDLTVTDDATIGGTLGVTGIVTLTDDLIIGDGKTIGSASDVDAITIAANGQLTLTQTLIGTALDISGDIDVDGTSNLDIVDIDGAVDMASTLAVAGVVTANAGVVVDNITIDGTEIDLSSGNLTLDVAGAIKLDADGGEVAFLDAGTEIGVISMGSSNMNIESKVADKDIIFKGIDGSSDLTALTIDMSAAGHATFNEGIKLSGLNAGTGLALDLSGSGDFVIKESSTNDVVLIGALQHNISSNALGIGAAPDVAIEAVTSDPRLRLRDNTAGGGSGNGGKIEFAGFHAGSGDGTRLFAEIHGLKTNSTGGDTHGDLKFFTNQGGASTTEGMRLNSDGDFIVGDVDFPNGNNSCFGASAGGTTSVSRAADNLQTQIFFQNPNGTVGTIKTTGSATQYNTSSDYRLKENVVTDWNATTLLKQLKPSKFNFKADASTTVHGFLAHEVSSIVPEAVSGEKDDVYTEADEINKEGTQGQPKYQGIDQSKLVPLLVKTVQEMEARITTLEG